MNNTVISHIGNDVIVKETKKGKITYDIMTNEELPDYFSTEFLNFDENGIVWVSDLRAYGDSIINLLYDMGYTDVTGENPAIKEMRSKTFKYVMEVRGNIYVIHIKRNKFSLSIYNVNNLLLNLSDEDIISTWGYYHTYDVMEHAASKRAEDVKRAMEEKKIYDLHNLVDAMYNGIDSLGGFNAKHTPFTLSMLASRIWRQTQGFGFNNPMLTDCKEYTAPNGETLADYIRKSYHGGWNYCTDKPYEQYKGKYGKVYDVNSEYPYVMLNRPIPYGKPAFFKGAIPDNIKNNDRYYYYVRVRLIFKLKEGSFPFLSKKEDFLYRFNGYLKNSNIEYTDNNGNRISTGTIIGLDGKPQRTFPEFVLSKTDYEMAKRHYDIIEEEVLDGVYYRTTKYMFKSFIEKYYDMKKSCRETGDKAGAMFAKMVMNSVSGTLGKRAIYTNILYEMGEDGLKHNIVENFNNSACYIHMASAILSYGREYVYEAACANYDNFLYSDTDSIHILGDEVKGIKIDNTEIGAWKVEHEFDNARYFKNKAYVLKTRDMGYKVTIAGMEHNFCRLVQDILNTEKLDPELDVWRFATDCYFGKYGPAEIISHTKREMDDDSYTGLVKRVSEFYDLEHFIKDISETDDRVSILAYIQYPSGWTYCDNFEIKYAMSWLTLNL